MKRSLNRLLTTPFTLLGAALLLCWMTSSCVEKKSRCGNEVIEGDEECDGTFLGGATCQSLGHQGGSLGCTLDCTFNELGCIDTCGDSAIQVPEVCDGTDTAGQTCLDLGQGFVGGTLLCASGCDGLDTSSCRWAECGDGVAEGEEVCDGTDLRWNDCRSIGEGFGCGDLACNGTCDGWVNDECLTTSATCGDGVMEGVCEVCDGTDFGGLDCTDFGYGEGYLVCHPRCGTILLHACVSMPWPCGDGVATFQQCDGTDLQGNDCESVGFLPGGQLSCTDTCRYDVSQCLGDLCGIMGYYNDGWCDPCEFQGGDPDPDCDTVCFVPDGHCTSWYGFAADSLSSCVRTKGREDPDCGCGNGRVDPNWWEDCDGDLFREGSCHEAYAGFTEGVGQLACDPNCNYDFSGCVPSETQEVTCDDRIDNDFDGLIDCLDPQCEGRSCGDGRCVAGACQ